MVTAGPADDERPGTELLTLDDYERAARAVLDPMTVAHVAGGAGAETTIAANRAALAELWLVPRIAARSSPSRTRRSPSSAAGWRCPCSSDPPARCGSCTTTPSPPWPGLAPRPGPCRS